MECECRYFSGCTSHKEPKFFPVAPSALVWLLDVFELGAHTKSTFFQSAIFIYLVFVGAFAM